ncbi:MAG: HAD-IIIC family phosphatase [Pseudomonadota bacterium]
MDTPSVKRLSWLPEAAPDFSETIAELSRKDGHGTADDLLALSRTALDLDQLIRVSALLKRPDRTLEGAGLTPVRLALLADGTMDYLAKAIEATGLRYGLHIETYAAAFGQSFHEVMSDDGPLWAFEPDCVFVAPDCRMIGLARPSITSDDHVAATTDAVDRLSLFVDRIEAMGATAILQTIVSPLLPWGGNLDANLPSSELAQIAEINLGVRAIAKDRGIPIVDTNALAATIGLEAWFAPSLWNRAKLPCALDVLPIWADHVCRVLGALKGKSRKCLVLDLDNTLWGGVIGDDGLNGIRLGQGSADGEAFLGIQDYALSLKARGIILAVVSKNNEENARLPFQKHPEMRLREDDISVFIANWDDKASNIAHVSKSLNIGRDALAFLDDNPAERAHVRHELPEVAVLELPQEPSHFPMLIAQSGLFETVALSKEDAERADQYRQNTNRRIAFEKISDYDAFLKSLDMKCTISHFDAVGRSRISQLINKSNQFNLTTRRYSEVDVANMEADPSILDLQVRLSDKFGDNGMISVVVFKKAADEWVCDTWLMSCRVIKRRVEEVVLAAVVDAAKSEGAKRLVGEYIPTAKNQMVADHFSSLGFQPSLAPEHWSGTRWVLELDDVSLPDVPMHVVKAFDANVPQSDVDG